MRNPLRPCPPEWPKLLAAAAASSFVCLFIAKNFFPDEKKIGHRVTTDYGPDEDVFRRTMGNLLGPPLLDGNRITILENGDEIFPAMIDAIRSAQRTVTFENFLLREGKVSDAFAEALVERAEAGVTVHVLQDALGCDSLHGRAMNRLRDSKVQLEIFRFLNLKMNYRTHRKLLAVDGKTGFIGGVGIADDWQGNGLMHGHWRDLQYRLEGPAVAQLQHAFIDNWLQTRAELLHGEPYFPLLETVGDETCQVFQSSAGEGSDSARVMLLVSIAAARHHIRIANAYFIPDNLIVRTLLEARERGVEIDVITPGPDTDAPLVRSVGKKCWEPLLKAGVRFYEYQPARYHCKYLLVDDCWASVGSANLDNRSLSLNEEANLNVHDVSFVKKHIEIFERDRSHSREVTLADWRRRPFKEKIRGNLGMLLARQM